MTADMWTPDTAVRIGERSHQRLLETIERLDDSSVQGRTLLPDWTVGHVLTHLARNADSYLRMMHGALQGVALQQYEGGLAQRAADIEAGAKCSANELISDVQRSVSRLEGTWARMTPEAWSGHGLNAEGEEWPCKLMPFHRVREVELHHVDLNLGYRPEDWPEEYATAELELSLMLLPDRLGQGEQRRLLAWLVGRAEQPRGLVLSAWQANRRHYFRTPYALTSGPVEYELKRDSGKDA